MQDSLQITNKKLDVLTDRFNNLEYKVDRGFTVLQKQIDSMRSELIQDYERHTGIVYEQMKHYVEAGLEQMKAITDKKLDRQEFYDYMELFEGRMMARFDSR